MALSPRAAQPVRGYDEEYCADKPTGRRIGISLSGGGIRSAAFNLGALQALQEEEVLGSAQYLAAVSGGGYIASALTISHAYAEPGAEDGHPLWAHGSPEERLLRRNTNYLAPGTAGRTWLVMNVLHGFVLNYLPFLLSGFVIGRVLGWLAHLAGVSLAHPPSSLVLVPLYGVGVFVLAAVAVVARARWRDGHKGVRGYGESSLEKWAALCIRLAGLALGVLALPWLAALYGAGTRAVLGYLGLPV
ncbi:MAG TPA: patatin-like phospholipase family protein, partial [Pseudonocardia sp.]|nr:patatin-like phospholipase family protein [Pseudonocardia sp.]